MDGETHNLQNDFFNTARKSKSPVTVFLGNGKKLTGKIKSFDKFTLLLETYQGELMVFKHAISTVSTATRCPWSMTWFPRASMNVDLPTPGAPEMPRRMDCPEWGISCSSNSFAVAR